MYTEFYGLAEKPFALLPDPRFLYLGSSHREALSHLLYGIDEGEGFIEVVGQVGTGKTTLCRTLLDRVGAEIDIAFIFNPARNEIELLTAINREFGLPTSERTRDDLTSALNEFLLKRKAEGRRTILVIDEAQNLSLELLEQVRLLSNLETEKEKLLQIVLIGQPELEENLSRSEIRQLRQRITVRWDLKPFNREETEAYVHHRLRVAGRRQAKPLFTPGAFRALHRASGGVPRLINAIADRALLAGYAATRERIDTKFIRRAARELAPPPPKRYGLGHLIAATSMAVTASAAIAFGALRTGVLGSPVEQTLPPVASAAIVERSQPIGAPIFASVVEGSELASLMPALRSRSAAQTASDALAQVLYLWGFGQPLAPEIAPNDLARVAGEVSPLRLLERRSSFEEIEALNLPVILELEPGDGDSRYVVLQKLDPDGTAVLAAAEKLVVIQSKLLKRYWRGKTLFLWSNYESMPTVEPGERGTAVRWVQERLTQLGYMNPGDPSGVYDRLTEFAIQELQTAYQITPTGKVGPETLIALYQALQYGGPRLYSRPAQTATTG